MIQDAIAKLPSRQQEVILLRDVAGWDPEDVSTALELRRRQPARAPAPRTHWKVALTRVEQYLEGTPHDSRCPLTMLGRDSPTARSRGRVYTMVVA